MNYRRLPGFIVAAALSVAVPAFAQTPTFSKDVAPIFFARCAQCHHPGGAGPFSVLTYGDVKPKATLIAAATKSRYMPPWKAEPVPGGFVGQTRLADEEINVIQRWVEGGALEGNPR